MAFPTTLTQAQDRNAVAGTCNTNGTAVARVSGNNFTSIICGYIEIGGSANSPGTLYAIASITDANNLVLATSAGVQTGAYWTAATEIKAAHLNALEAKVGVDGSAVTTSLDYKISHLLPFPVGAVFLSVVATNPATLLGYGTWAAFGTGRMLVGIDTGQTEFNTVEKTGGDKSKNLAHTHSTPALSHSCNNQPRGDLDNSAVSTISDHPAGTTGSGGSATQDVLNPYIVVYMWKRTA
jgi:hypothetical protein